MLLASSFDQSKYFTAENFEGEKKLRIKEGTEESIGETKERKLVVWFTNDLRGLPLNKTNRRTLRGEFGDPVDGWKGKIITLYRTEADFRGKSVAALRIRIPAPKQARPASTTDALNSFAAPPAQEAKPTTKPAPAVTPEPEADFDLDDEIPY